MEHVFKTIDELDSKIAEHDRIAAEHFALGNKLRSTVNDLCGIAGLDPKYSIDPSAGPASPAPTPKLPAIKPDEFYGKPLASAVRSALIMLRSKGKAPATIEAIYDILVSGGFEFQSKAKDAAIQGLSVSIGKNSVSFVKLRSGLIGLKEWYPRKARASSRNQNDEGGEEPPDGEELPQENETPPAEATDGGPS